MQIKKLFFTPVQRGIGWQGWRLSGRGTLFRSQNGREYPDVCARRRRTRPKPAGRPAARNFPHLPELYRKD